MMWMKDGCVLLYTLQVVKWITTGREEKLLSIETGESEGEKQWSIYFLNDASVLVHVIRVK